LYILPAGGDIINKHPSPADVCNIFTARCNVNANHIVTSE